MLVNKLFREKHYIDNSHWVYEQLFILMARVHGHKHIETLTALAPHSVYILCNGFAILQHCFFWQFQRALNTFWQNAFQSGGKCRLRVPADIFCAFGFVCAHSSLPLRRQQGQLCLKREGDKMLGLLQKGMTHWCSHAACFA